MESQLLPAYLKIFERIRKFSPLAIQFLKACSYLSLEAIPRKFFENLEKESHVSDDHRSTDQAFMQLFKYSMLTGGGGISYIHPTTQAIVRKVLIKNEEEYTILNETLNSLLLLPREKVASHIEKIFMAKKRPYGDGALTAVMSVFFNKKLLPNVIIKHRLSMFLSVKETVQMGATCKDFHGIAQDAEAKGIASTLRKNGS
jgi:hypothetical protein